MEKTNRGFDITSFKDANGEQCSLQKSSSAMQDKIWLGVHENRMHLTQEQVSELLPYLVNFVETGELGDFKPIGRKLYTEQDMDNAYDKGFEHGVLKGKGEYDNNGNPIVTEEEFHTCDGLLKLKEKGK